MLVARVRHCKLAVAAAFDEANPVESAQKRLIWTNPCRNIVSRNTPVRHVRLWFAGGLLVLLYGGLIWDQATPDPPHSGGLPIYVYVSVFVVAIAGGLLGATLTQRPAMGEGRVRTAVAQLLATVVLFTPVVGIYAVFDPSYLTPSIAGGWYVAVSVVGVVLVAASHLLDYVLNDALAVRSEPT